MYAGMHVCTHAYAGTRRCTPAPKRAPTAPHPPPVIREGRTIHAHTHHLSPQHPTAPHQWRRIDALRSDSKRTTNPLGVSVPHKGRKSLKTAENRLAPTRKERAQKKPHKGASKIAVVCFSKYMRCSRILEHLPHARMIPASLRHYHAIFDSCT